VQNIHVPGLTYLNITVLVRVVPVSQHYVIELNLGVDETESRASHRCRWRRGAVTVGSAGAHPGSQSFRHAVDVGPGGTRWATHVSPASQAGLLKPRGAAGARADEKEATAVYCRPFCEPWATNRLARFKQPLPTVDPWRTIKVPLIKYKGAIPALSLRGAILRSGRGNTPDPACNPCPAQG
jgi:hypothetical protein